MKCSNCGAEVSDAGRKVNKVLAIVSACIALLFGVTAYVLYVQNSKLIEENSEISGKYVALTGDYCDSREQTERIREELDRSVSSGEFSDAVVSAVKEYTEGEYGSAASVNFYASSGIVFLDKSKSEVTAFTVTGLYRTEYNVSCDGQIKYELGEFKNGSAEVTVVPSEPGCYLFTATNARNAETVQVLLIVEE